MLVKGPARFKLSAYLVTIKIDVITVDGYFFNGGYGDFITHNSSVIYCWRVGDSV